ncbi:MAG: YerC/YecD family TrpR-related protein [Lachnospiraceae bacterium]|nr:YerC/YecD family TrpR-related protein [Lachnospiraceae bacterium]
MNRNTPKERKYSIYKAILELKDLDECIAFFDDVCAVTELRSMEQRFEVAKMLHENKVYTEIMEQTSASSATISRVNRMLQYGTGCLPNILDRMEEEKKAKAEEKE